MPHLHLSRRARWTALLVAPLLATPLVAPLPARAATTSKPAAKPTAKPTARTVARATTTVKAGTARVAAGTATATTVALRRDAGTPLAGWERMDPTEWPVSGSAVVAAANGPTVDVFRAPGDRDPQLRFRRGRSMHGDVTFLVLGRARGFVRVTLPVRPNGTIGYVREADVTLAPVGYQIVVDLASHTVTLEENGKTVFRDAVAVGTGGTPTPEGLFYVKERVPQANPGGALGPVALGLSGFSTVLYSFAGGQGAIGMHGTNSPSLIGRDVSHGCVRMRNDTIKRLASTVPLGTPVEIVDGNRRTAGRIDVAKLLTAPGPAHNAVPAAASGGSGVIPVLPTTTAPGGEPGPTTTAATGPTTTTTTTTTATSTATAPAATPAGATGSTTTVA